MNYFELLRKKIIRRNAIICIIGLGYVGSGILKSFHSKGFKTIGVDIDSEKIKKKFIKKNLTLTKNYKNIKVADVIIIALPTPLTKNLNPDLSFLKKSLKLMSPYLKKGQLISLESSTYPGTTEEIIASFLKKKNFNLSQDFFLVYSPERISPELKIKKNKKIKYNLNNTPKICAGYSNKCLKLGEEIYNFVTTDVVLAPNLKTAETSKMVENVFRSVNIALVNELKMFLNKINIDINEVLNLAGTKPFGFTKFNPGPGYGGHCIPLDPFYLYWLAKKNKFDLKFVKTAGLINRKITSWISKKLINFIAKKKLKLFKKKILILGMAYKKDIDDTRESPGLIIAEKLKKEGYDFEYSDPHVNKIKFNGLVKKSKKLTNSLFSKFKVVVIVTDHSSFDYKLISKKSKYLFDCRNSVHNRKKNYFKI
jgi:UDP-N-acetyl-D-glucosamine dehydrogenase